MQLESKLNLFIQRFYQEEKLKLQNDKLWSSIRIEDELGRSKLAYLLKYSNCDHEPIWENDNINRRHT